MSKNKGSGNAAKGSSASTGASAASAASQEVAANAAEEVGQGFRGIEVDPTPNENYTVAGVTAKKPTPETDPGAAAAAREVTGGPVSAVGRNAEESK